MPSHSSNKESNLPILAVLQEPKSSIVVFNKLLPDSLDINVAPTALAKSFNKNGLSFGNPGAYIALLNKEPFWRLFNNVDNASPLKLGLIIVSCRV